MPETSIQGGVPDIHLRLDTAYPRSRRYCNALYQCSNHRFNARAYLSLEHNDHWRRDSRCSRAPEWHQLRTGLQCTPRAIRTGRPMFFCLSKTAVRAGLNCPPLPANNLAQLSTSHTTCNQLERCVRRDSDTSLTCSGFDLEPWALVQGCNRIPTNCITSHGTYICARMWRAV